MPAFNYILVFTLTSSFGLLLTLYRRFFVVFSFTNLSQYAGFCTGSLKSSERAVERLIFFYTNF